MTGGWWFKEVHQWYTKGMKYYFLLCFVCSVKNFIDRSCFQSKLPPQSLPSYQSLSYFVFSFLFKVLKFCLWWCYTKYYKSIFLLVLPWKNVMVLWLSECFFINPCLKPVLVIVLCSQAGHFPLTGPLPPKKRKHFMGGHKSRDVVAQYVHWTQGWEV